MLPFLGFSFFNERGYIIAICLQKFHFATDVREQKQKLPTLISLFVNAVICVKYVCSAYYAYYASISKYTRYDWGCWVS